MLYSKEQLHLGLSARRTGGGQRDQGSPWEMAHPLKTVPARDYPTLCSAKADPYVARMRGKERVDKEAALSR